MILIDDRIGSADLGAHLTRLGVPWRHTRLEFGDGMFLGHGAQGTAAIGIEVKTLGDLLNCISSGRFAGHQLPGLLAEYHAVWLVVEGIWQSSPEGVLEDLHGGGWRPAGHGQRRWMYRDVDNYLTSLEVRGGIHLRRSASRPETARILADLYRWWEKPWEEHRGHVAIYLPPPPVLALRPPTLTRRVASLLPGVGWEKAQAVEAMFRSVVTLAAASEQAWREVAGIGKVLAARIWRALREEDQ